MEDAREEWEEYPAIPIQPFLFEGGIQDPDPTESAE